MNHLLVSPLPFSTRHPAPAELSVSYPRSGAPVGRNRRGLAKLDKYAQCLAAAGDSSEGSGSDKAASAVRLRSEDLARCRTLVREARDLRTGHRPARSCRRWPTFPLLQRGRSLDAVMRAAAALRAELLVRNGVSGSGRSWLCRRSSDGRKSGLAHASLCLGRQPLGCARTKSEPPARESVDERAKRPWRQSTRCSIDLCRERPEQRMARTTGANDFMKAAQDAMAVVRPTDGKPRSEFAAAGRLPSPGGPRSTRW